MWLNTVKLKYFWDEVFIQIVLNINNSSNQRISIDMNYLNTCKNISLKLKFEASKSDFHVGLE